METIERSIKSQLTPSELQQIGNMCTQLNYFNDYFKRLTTIESRLSYPEYKTLKNDFYNVYEELCISNLVIRLYIISSLTKSLQLILGRFNSCYIVGEGLFTDFIKDSITRLQTITESVLEPQQ